MNRNACTRTSSQSGLMVPSKLLAALIAKKNSSGREKAIHPVESATPRPGEIGSAIAAFGPVLSCCSRFGPGPVCRRDSLPLRGWLGFVAPLPYAFPVFFFCSYHGTYLSG